MQINVLSMPDPTDETGLDGLVASVVEVEQAGFDRVWMPQLPAFPGMPCWDALTAIAVAGQSATRIELATGIVVAYTQHPLALARQALTTDAALGGRLTLGIGVSHPVILEPMGYRHEKPAAFLREYLEILDVALKGAPVDHHGAQLTAVGQVELPGTAVRPPVIAAALGPMMLDVAGELTDGVMTSWAGPKTLENHIIPRISKAASAAGRPSPRVIADLPVVVTSDPQAGRELVAAMFGASDDAPAYRKLLDSEGVDSVVDVCLVGNEEQVAARVRHMAEIGVTEFVATVVGDRATKARTLELLASLRR